jgi:ribonuclease HII
MNAPKHIRHIVGIDEAGRGPLAGPVAVGVFCISTQFAQKDFKKFSRGVRDSKKLTARKREDWFAKILSEKKNGNLSFAVSFASAQMIDRRGIVFAIRHAMKKALSTLPCDPSKTLVYLDGGLRAPEEFLFQETIIRGDDLIPEISLASIAAKVSRDALMLRLANKYPEYGFEKHKGYGTAKHYEKIKEYGVVEGVHRKSFLKKFLITNI